MIRSPALAVVVIVASLLLFLSIATSQPTNDKEWQTATIATDAITIECADLLLPFETGDLLQEPDPIGTDTGEMTETLRSAHPIKILLQPESGTSDTLATISGCGVDGTEVWLATQDTGDVITVQHTAGQLEMPFGEEGVQVDFPLSHPNTILKIIRKSGKWIAISAVGGSGGGGSSSLNTAHQLGNSITGADVDRPFNVGDGTRYFSFYGDVTEGAVRRAVPDQDFSFYIPTDRNFCWYDEENSDAAIMCIDPDATTSSALYTFPTAAYRPLGLACFGAEAMTVKNGCNPFAQETLGTGGPAEYTIICTDNDADTVEFNTPFPLNWDGGDIRAYMVAVSTTDQDGSAFHMHVSGRCGLGTLSTAGEQLMSVTYGTGVYNEQTSAVSNAISLNGTCAAGSKVYLQAQVDQTGTTVTMANNRLLEICISYARSSLSN